MLFYIDIYHAPWVEKRHGWWLGASIYIRCRFYRPLKVNLTWSLFQITTEKMFLHLRFYTIKAVQNVSIDILCSLAWWAREDNRIGVIPGVHRKAIRGIRMWAISVSIVWVNAINNILAYFRDLRKRRILSCEAQLRLQPWYPMATTRATNLVIITSRSSCKWKTCCLDCSKMTWITLKN